MGNDYDRLVHVLLREIVGGETPPDVTEKVLARAFVEPRRTITEKAPPAVTERALGRAIRRAWPRRWHAAAAAGAIAAVLVVSVMLGRYPAPQISGAYTIVEPAPEMSGAYTLKGGESLVRGSVIVTEDRSAVITLGDYCRIELQPESALQIKGGKKAEQVLLERGAVECEVDEQVGAFAVETEIGTVSVVGTKFAVRLIEEKGDAARRRDHPPTGATGRLGRGIRRAGSYDVAPLRHLERLVGGIGHKTVIPLGLNHGIREVDSRDQRIEISLHF